VLNTARLVNCTDKDKYKIDYIDWMFNPLLLLSVLLTKRNKKKITQFDCMSGYQLCLCNWKIEMRRGLNRLNLNLFLFLLILLTKRNTIKITQIKVLRHCLYFYLYWEVEIRASLHMLSDIEIACLINCTDNYRYEKDYTDWVLKILTVFINVLANRNKRKITL
jgi:hypothetical protein